MGQASKIHDIELGMKKIHVTGTRVKNPNLVIEEFNNAKKAALAFFLCFVAVMVGAMIGALFIGTGAVFRKCKF